MKSLAMLLSLWPLYGTLEPERKKIAAETIYGRFNTNENIEVTKCILDGSHLSAWPEPRVKALTYLYAKK